MLHYIDPALDPDRVHGRIDYEIECVPSERDLRRLARHVSQRTDEAEADGEEEVLAELSRVRLDFVDARWEDDEEARRAARLRLEDDFVAWRLAERAGRSWP